MDCFQIPASQERDTPQTGQSRGASNSTG